MNLQGIKINKPSRYNAGNSPSGEMTTGPLGIAFPSYKPDAKKEKKKMHNLVYKLNISYILSCAYLINKDQVMYLSAIPQVKKISLSPALD